MHPEYSTLIGTWFISGLDVVPGEDGILVMLPDGRCVQFPSSVTPPRMNQTFRLWYSCPDAKTIRFRAKPDGEEWPRLVEETSEGWTMICDDGGGRRGFSCRRAEPEELPEWFANMMDANLEAMAALEDQ